MKKISKYCKSILLSFVLSSSFLAAAEPTQQGKLIWADLYTSDVKASLDFYRKTFDWSVKKFGDKNARYHLLYDGEHAIAGVLARPATRNKTESALWIGSIATDSVEENVNSANQHKATIILQPHDFALYGKRAVIADPQGGVIALLDIDEKNKEHQKISQRWDWAQLFSVDTEKAAMFYKNAFNYSVERVSTEQSALYLVQKGEIRASVVKLPESYEQRDRWVNFIEVVNLNTTLTKAIANGATIIHQPESDTLAIIADPHGALLGLVEQEVK